MARHIYRCPLRWADMDQLGHVNNVIYVDYLQEARVDMLRVHAAFQGGEALAEGVVVVRNEVEFRAPLVFRREPVTVESWVTEIRGASFTIGYEIFDELPGGERRVYLRASTVLTPYVFASERPRRISPEERAVLEQYLEPPGQRPEPRPAYGGPPPGAVRYVCQVRFSDVDAYGHVNNVKYYEYYQEARIALVAELAKRHPEEPRPSLVVARLDVDYRRPIRFRAEPYAVDSWVVRVGGSSFVLAAEIRDGDEVLSRSQAVMVTFDPATQRSVPLTGSQRAVLSKGLEPVAGT